MKNYIKIVYTNTYVRNDR